MSMRYTHPLLKHLFMAVARQPLIGPHSDHEVALLQAGAKPVGMLSPKDEAENIAILQKEVEAGKLLRLDVDTTSTWSYLIYAWPQVDIDALSEIHKEMTTSLLSDKTPPVSVREKFSRAVEQTNLAGFHMESRPVNARNRAITDITLKLAQHLPPSIEKHLNLRNTAFSRLPHMNAQEFLAGERQAYVARQIGDWETTPPDLQEDFHRKQEQGLIQCRKTDCVVNNTIVVFGQNGQEKNMEDLACILREYNEQKTPEMDARGLTPLSEGQILGYSDRDIEFFQNRASFSNLHRSLLYYTDSIRRDIRIGLMKEMGPQWKRNP